MKKKAKSRTASPVIQNRRARHDYEVLDTVECGIALWGAEVKSLRAGMANFTGSWCSVEKGQLILHGMHITKYDTTNAYDTDEKRDRVLLAHKSEIRKMAEKVKQDGVTLIPLEAKWNRQHCKISLGICRGKHLYDKRQSLKENDIKREMSRMAKSGME